MRFPEYPVIIVDDDEMILNCIKVILNTVGLDHVICYTESREALGYMEQNPVSLVLLDLMLPGIKGEDVLDMVHRNSPEVPVVIITGTNDVEKVVACIKQGAFDYLVKPVTRETLITCVKRALQFRELQLENVAIKHSLFSQEVKDPQAFSAITTGNDKMKMLFQYAEAIARTSEAILISGETGTGKGLMAEAIHKVSRRKGKFIKVNVAGIDDAFFSDTLFGHKKGAYTGADENRQGLVEQAAGGTLFLDEIGDLPQASQVKLLRLAEDHEYLPVGADLFRRTDARIIAATNQDLAAGIAEGKFRKDLFYRLDIHHIHLPPLRERLNDLPLLVYRFLQEGAADMQVRKPAVLPELFTLLRLYNFPGNVRELRGMVINALSSHKHGVLALEHFRKIIPDRDSREESTLEKEGTEKPENFFLRHPLPTLKEAEAYLISKALELAENNQSLAARLLGITRQAINYHLKKGK